MAYRDGPFENLKVPALVGAAAVAIVAVAAAVLLLIADRRAEASPLTPVRAGAEATLGPVNGVFAYPVRWVGAVSDWLGGYFFAVSENRRLKKEIAELQAVRDANIALANVNRRYETLLGIRTQPPVPLVTARSISDARGPFANARLIDVGTGQGVQIGNPVINEHGLVGRVSGTAPNVSRVVLLTDVSSQVPVLIDRSDARAILSGDGSGNPRLEYVRGEDALKVGDRVLSSGDGGGMPRGLPVGVVARGVDGSWRVKLFSDRGAIDFVRVLKFEAFGQLVTPEALNAPPLAALDSTPAARPPEPAAQPGPQAPPAQGATE
ncbi:MAG: rod shape-determining protein MreC [Caulobacteraceae bacterium]|nr:rod shape-determining protein MreC [Caulobacteraceae bacterium]